MVKNENLSIRASTEFIQEMRTLHEDYKRAEMSSLSFSSFLEMLVRHGAKQIRSRVEATAYADTDTH